MPKYATCPSPQESEHSANQSSLRRGPNDNFSDYLQWDCDSPEDLRDLLEATERLRRGEEETYSMEEAFEGLDMEDALHQAGSAPTE